MINKKKRVDLLFKARFNIKTPINYLPYSEVDPKIQDRFQKYYKRRLSSINPDISKYRKAKFDSFLRELAKDGGDEKYCKRVAIKYISKKVGYGVFAKEDIAPYSTLHHYTGLLVHDDDLDSDHDSTFSFSGINSYSLDALNRGNWTRFMNHSDLGTPTNNVVAWEYYTKQMPYIIFTSGPRGIKKGDQLLYSYGDEYWEEKQTQVDL
ncbi:hypothetical protein COB21_01815 [Candidatus Aerophobetes bacterium]|uniref:SET domain-containing protein n=1 Tax=Aerophobetes bacterium TaxID=2030807 RepID=A0A2A4X6X0_UNCAE|nr:MAG: hypothetical protein COB21_01815 [Candidatus Aerophobetes bacterium]